MATGPTNVAVSVAPAPRDLPLEQTDRRVALRAYALFGWLIPLALCHGLLYMLILPPWQHYDEPPHFEYAWLIADRGRTVDSVVQQYLEVVRPGHYMFIEPTKAFADLIVPEGALNQRALEVLSSFFEKVMR